MLQVICRDCLKSCMQQVIIRTVSLVTISDHACMLDSYDSATSGRVQNRQLPALDTASLNSSCDCLEGGRLGMFLLVFVLSDDHSSTDKTEMRRFDK